MAIYSVHVRTTQRTEVTIPSPCPLAEFEKAKAAVRELFRQVHGRTPEFDNDIYVTADDQIVLWFEHENTLSSGY